MKFLLNTQDCRICGAPVSLESCKTNEYGQAVHELCYVEEFLLTQQLLRCEYRYNPLLLDAEWDFRSAR